MITIFKKEIKTLFTGFWGYSFVALFALVVVAIRMIYHYLTMYERVLGYINTEYVLTFLPIALTVSAPLLVFGLFSEERKSGVKEFMKSLPFSTLDIFFGKILAVYAAFGMTYAAIVVVSWVLGFYKNGFIWAIPAFLLVGIALLSVNIFVSAVTENKFIGLGINYGISVLVSLYCVFRGDMPKILENILEPISIIGAYDSSVYGILDIASIVLWVSLTVAFSVLTFLFFKKEFDK